MTAATLKEPPPVMDHHHHVVPHYHHVPHNSGTSAASSAATPSQQHQHPQQQQAPVHQRSGTSAQSLPATCSATSSTPQAASSSSTTMPPVQAGISQTLGAVPMQLYANWEVDRASSSTIQRILTIVVTRLHLTGSLRHENNLVVVARLQGHKRTLRSNDVGVLSANGDVSLELSFTIQYSHYIKRKSNILHILVQRRKRYKSRHIPGFKTLAIAYLNLDDVLQHAGLRQVQLWDTAYLNKNDADLSELNIGTVYLSNCQSQALDAEGTTKKSEAMSEDEEEDTTEESEMEEDYPDARRYGNPKQRLRVVSRKKVNQKNIKSKLSALLRRFKAQQDGSGGRTRGQLPPTEEELEEIFEELENISDSGPELEPDKVSIVSNPKPGLRPIFGSKTELLPPIVDPVPSDEETDDQDFSSENERRALFLSSVQIDGPPQASDQARNGDEAPSAGQRRKLVHSTTAGSLGEHQKYSVRKNAPEGAALADVMSTLEDPESFIASNVWLGSSVDVPWLSRIDVAAFKAIRFIDCPTSADVRAALYAIIARIQKFCNTNSVAPPTTVIGLVGGDRLVSNVLRVYVDILQNKTAQNEWLNYLRFALVTPPGSVTGRTLALNGDGRVLELRWKALTRINSTDPEALEECLASCAGRSVNLPIGEVMLQFAKSEAIPDESGSQVFIPFVSEIHLGNLEELNSPSASAGDDDFGGIGFSAGPGSGAGGAGSNGQGSPPNSPQMAKGSNDGQELQLEYWTTSNGQDATSTAPSFSAYGAGGGTSDRSQQQSGQSPQVSKQSTGGKYSLKASVRSMSIAREPTSSLMSMLFVKESRKDKVLQNLQKLGRKTKSRTSDTSSPSNLNSQSRVVSSVSRMVCSAIGKHSPLDVSIDGITWSGVRFFQVTAQWQTHVKFFPVCMPTTPPVSSVPTSSR